MKTSRGITDRTAPGVSLDFITAMTAIVLFHLIDIQTITMVEIYFLNQSKIFFRHFDFSQYRAVNVVIQNKNHTFSFAFR